MMAATVTLGFQRVEVSGEWICIMVGPKEIKLDQEFSLEVP
jgi:hypothetical protein